MIVGPGTRFTGSSHVPTARFKLAYTRGVSVLRGTAARAGHAAHWQARPSDRRSRTPPHKTAVCAASKPLELGLTLGSETRSMDSDTRATRTIPP